MRNECTADYAHAPQALPSIINAALLTSAWSAASSDLYTGE